MPYDESQPEPSTEPDTPNATKFHPDDADYDGYYRADGIESYHDYYARLAALNAGVWTHQWADQTLLRQQDNLAVFDSVASALELTPYQKERGRIVFSTLNLQELSSPEIDAALVAAMTAAVVVREDGRMYHPSRADNNNDGLFLRFLRDSGYSRKAVRSCYEKVLHRVDL